MRGGSTEILVLLPSIHHVMKAEARLLDAGLSCDLIPVPREIASDCGMAVLVSHGDLEEVLAVLARADLPVSACHRKMGRSYELVDPEKEGSG